ncbi:MAG: hypothetical protein ACOCP8_01130 [archaeon]
MNKIKKQRQEIKKYNIIGRYFNINDVPKEIKQKIPEKLLENYYDNINKLESINDMITRETKRWVDTQEETIKIEKAINKLLEE